MTSQKGVGITPVNVTFRLHVGYNHLNKQMQSVVYVRKCRDHNVPTLKRPDRNHPDKNYSDRNGSDRNGSDRNGQTETSCSGGGNIPRRTWKTSQSTAISDSSSSSTPRRDQARSVMKSRHLVLGRHLGHFPVTLASRTCLTNILWGILDTWTNQCGWVLSIRRSVSTFRALRISQLHSLSWSVTPVA